MNLSMNWLSDYVDIKTTPKEFSERMTMSGSKVEGFASLADEIENVCVGKVLSIEPHPDADKLVVCQIDVGEVEAIQIVTGAKNLTVGDLIPVARDKSKLPGGKEIRKGKLRGIVSNGMLCSLSELNLTKADFPDAIEDGIFVLTEDCNPGDDISKVLSLDDITVEFEITSNRPDCLSVRGLALEAAATYGVPFKKGDPTVKGSGGDITQEVEVEVENTVLCPRIMTRLVKNIKIEPSPRWMRERLRASGMRPINNLVDITNYVMLEYGQPMHAYDARFVADQKLIVRNAKANEKIVTLDGSEHNLTEDMLLIADKNGPIGVAGVMGGQNSDIKEDTRTVIFEAANFDPVSVRLTAKALGMRTEASARFEKGLDPNNCEKALDRACELIEKLGCGEVVDGVIDIANFDKTPVTMDLDVDWTNRFLGIDLSQNEMQSILEKIDFQVEGTTVIVPTFRADVRHKADLAEEIARFYGYNKIPNTFLKGEAKGKITKEQAFSNKIIETLSGFGGDEICTYTFTSPSVYQKLEIEEENIPKNMVRIMNPLGEERSVMRTMLMPSMLDALSLNYNNRNSNVSLFEIGTVYLTEDETQQPDEVSRVAIGQYGNEVDFFTLKGTVETLLKALKVENYEINAKKDLPYYHPGRCAQITNGEKVLGIFGEIHPRVLSNYEIGTKAYVAILDVAVLQELSKSEFVYEPWAKFPSIWRDLALVADVSIPAGDIEKIILQAGGNLLEGVSLFDVYTGNQIGENQKSLAYRLTFRSKETTLKDEEVDAKIGKILKSLDKIQVKLRA